MSQGFLTRFQASDIYFEKNKTKIHCPLTFCADIILLVSIKF